MKTTGIDRIKKDIEKLPRSLLPLPLPGSLDPNIRMNELLRKKTVEIYSLGFKGPTLMTIHNVVVDPPMPYRKIHLLSDHGTEERIPEDKIWNFLRGELVITHDSSGEEYGISLRGPLTLKQIRYITDSIGPISYH